jgi:LmbE family N-acetylglucosaminyl deacetylase
MAREPRCGSVPVPEYGRGRLPQSRVASYTVVSFHAHPDDEALLVSGTLARLAAEGHRVVLVSATAGEGGLAASSYGTADELAAHRREELQRSARAVGAARVEFLGYGDSGLDGRAVPPHGMEAFARADVDAAAQRLAALLLQERADVLTSYDPSGGYGHPDHVQVHHVGARAAELAGTPVVLEATVDQDLLRRAVRLASLVYRFPPEFDRSAFERAYAPRSVLTHKVDVRAYADAKRASMAAHSSQATADTGDRTLAALLRLPQPLYRRVLGREWFVERGRRPGPRLLDDVFASLRDERAASAGPAGP